MIAISSVMVFEFFKNRATNLRYQKQENPPMNMAGGTVGVDSQFRPLNEDHAIESVKFAVLFGGALLPPAIAAVEAQHGQWRDGLPALSASDITIGSGGRQINMPGVTFAFVRPDASPNWSMNVAGNKIEIECFLYSRWDKIWATTFDYFKKVLEVVSSVQGDLGIVGVELTVRDVFVSKDNAYKLESLFQRTSRLPPVLFETNALWHCNMGWFAPESSKARHLHNLNCDAIPAGDDSVTVNISHYQQRGMAQAVSLEDAKSDNFRLIENEMSEIHRINKELLIEMLNRDMLERIGLIEVKNGDVR